MNVCLTVPICLRTRGQLDSFQTFAATASHVRVVTWWLAGALPESATMTAVWVQGPITCSRYVSIGAQTFEIPPFQRQCHCNRPIWWAQNVAGEQSNRLNQSIRVESIELHLVNRRPSNASNMPSNQRLLFFAFSSLAPRWHESSKSKLAQVRCVIETARNSWPGTRIHSKQSADSRHLEGFKKLTCVWLIHLSQSHTIRLSTGLAASREMFLQATCLQIKGALGFPKRMVLFVVLFYVQPWGRHMFHTSSFWGLGLPNGVQSLQAKTLAGWKMQFGSDFNDKAISDVPMIMWIPKLVSSEVGNRSPSKDGCRRVPPLLLEMQSIQFWLIQTPVCRSEGIQRASAYWELVSFMQNVPFQGGDGRTREESESLAASRQRTFRIQCFSLKSSQTARIG